MQTQVLNGRYELHTPLGQGGMATVYRGRDLRLGRPVAIKLLHNYYNNDDEFLQRFQHEALSAAQLSSHPNIVDVYDVGQEGDLNYIVMELIEGEDLKALIERTGPLPPDQALTIAAQTADGLDYAHRRGLIHRDVKPQNVLITPDGHVRIADFGIAKSHLSTAVTQAGMTFGTADYISPEQAQGMNATPQSDIYSLGVVLFEMLSGHLPYTGDTPMAVALQHIQQPPPSVRRFNPSIPPALDAIVGQAMAKDAQQRPASAKAFAQELRDYLAGRSQATVVTPLPQARPQPAPRQPAPLYPEPTQTIQVPSPQAYQSRRPQPQYVAPPPLAVAPPRERGGGFGTLLIGMLLLLGVLTLAYFALQPGAFDWLNVGGGTASGPDATATPTETPTAAPTDVPLVALPNFVGRTEAEVAGPGGALEQLGLVRRNAPDDPAAQPRNDLAPRGTVIEQSPVPGTEVPVGSEVTIVVSLGPAVVDVPDVARQRADTAQATLQEAGFNVEVQQVPSRDIQQGFVVSQSPAGGLRIPQGETITLNVSAGDVVAFPDVIQNGTLRDEAIRRIEAAGFRVVFVNEQGADQLGPAFSQFAVDEVVSAAAGNNPIDVPGELLPRGAEIILAVRAP
jgi:eukaryotic-like serine/threonine-protein kinase